jgi:hypothetical protein
MGGNGLYIYTARLNQVVELPDLPQPARRYIRESGGMQSAWPRVEGGKMRSHLKELATPTHHELSTVLKNFS